MNEGLRRYIWEPVSHLMALFANAHCEDEEFHPADFNPALEPWERKNHIPEITDENVHIMRDEFRNAFG